VQSGGGVPTRGIKTKFWLHESWNAVCISARHFQTSTTWPRIVAKNDNQSRSEQREAILRYLAACPNAADTADGVLNWWFPRQRYNDARDDVERALEDLAAEGRLARLKLPDGRVIYACRQEDVRSDR
jgi:hypothetical protein